MRLAATSISRRNRSGRQLGSQDLDCHLAMLFEILGQVDRLHAAAAQFFLDDMAVGKSGLQALQVIAQAWLK